MKKNHLLLLGLAILIGSIQPILAQSKKEKREQKKKEVKELTLSGFYTIEATRAMPMGGRSVYLTSPYSIELKGDSIISHLPYYGRAYNIPYNGGEGLRFSAPITERILSFDKKGNASIRFRARTEEDHYTFNVKVFTNGKSTIQVQPVNKQGISFQGELVEKSE